MRGKRERPVPLIGRLTRTMRTPTFLVSLLVLSQVIGCAARVASPPASTPPFVESGFLTTDYSLLTPVKPSGARRTYANPEHPFSQYPRLFVDRITIWRNAEQTEPVESSDFQRVVDDLYAVVTRRFARTFTLVDAPGPAVARLRIALVALDAPDDKLDVYVSAGSPAVLDTDVPLPAGLRDFGREAWMEAEMLDGATHDVIFAVVDRVPDVLPRPRPIKTWHDLHECFVAWAEQATERLTTLKNQQS